MIFIWATVSFSIPTKGIATMEALKLVSGHIEEYKEYSNFISLKDFNNNFEMIAVEYKDEFTDGEWIALNRLRKYAAKHKGVAYARIAIILKEINKRSNGYGISRSTFERMLRKAKKLGIIDVKNTTRAKGGIGHNVYVFNTYEVAKSRKLTYRENAENPCESKSEQPQNEPEALNLSKAINLKDLKERKEKRSDNLSVDNINNEQKDEKQIPVKVLYLDASFVRDNRYKEFIEYAANFYNNDPDMIRELIKATKQQSYKAKKAIQQACEKTGYFMNRHMIKLSEAIDAQIRLSAEDVAIDAFKDLYNALKGSKKVGNPVGLFASRVSEIMLEKLQEIKDRVAADAKAEMYPKRDTSFYYNWLEDDE